MRINKNELSTQTLDSLMLDGKYMSYLSSLNSYLDIARQHDKLLSWEQEVGLTLGYLLVKRGAKLTASYKSLGLPGYRDHQTYIFVTDPGPGHIELITRNKTLMDGATVHIEYIDREAIKDKELIEAYRMPSDTYISFVRLNVGEYAPTSCYIGRPMFEGLGYGEKFVDYKYEVDNTYINLFDNDELKTVHYTAGACSSAFAHGICDAKIAIEKMSYTQSIDFMKAVRANVVRDESRQYLSAAFNLFTPIDFIDYSSLPDKPGNVTRHVTDPIEIAYLAINITVEGGFDKVTWDGASNKVPSAPILYLLGHENLTALVHKAHENGLITYISAGMEPEDIEGAIMTGVDGIGIGTALHYVKNDESKLIGAFNPIKIYECLENRSNAEKTIRGKGAKLLASMDWDYYCKTLTKDENKDRQLLFNAVTTNNTAIIQNYLNKYENRQPSKTSTVARCVDRLEKADNPGL